MAETDRSQAGIKGIHRMLSEIIRIAKEASLTGALADGALVSVRQYNASVEFLEQSGQLPPGLFRHLPDDAKFDEVGVAAGQLAAFLKGDDSDEGDAPRVSGSNNVIIGFGHLKEIKELKELGQYVRDRLPDWLKPKASTEATSECQAKSGSDIDSRLADVSSRLQEVVEELRSEDISDDRRIELSEELSQLGHEQAELAREKRRQQESSTTS